LALKLGEIRVANPVDAGFNVLKLGADRVIGLCEVQEGLVLGFRFQNPADIAGELSDQIIEASRSSDWLPTRLLFCQAP
jgi:hypothetical protein